MKVINHLELIRNNLPCSKLKKKLVAGGTGTQLWVECSRFIPLQGFSCCITNSITSIDVPLYSLCHCLSGDLLLTDMSILVKTLLAPVIPLITKDLSWIWYVFVWNWNQTLIPEVSFLMKHAYVYTTQESLALRHDLSFYSDLQYFLLCTQFLDRCTEAVGLPFAARRLYTADGKEVSSLSDLQRNDLVYVTCGEPWSDPQLSYSEQQRRAVLANLAADISHIRQYCALRDPSGIVNILRLLAFSLMGSIVA